MTALSRGDAEAWCLDHGVLSRIYFTAPPLGMLLAAEARVRLRGRVFCAKLHHDNPTRCIFCAWRAERPA